LGLNHTTGTFQDQMIHQFAQGLALSTYNASVVVLAKETKKKVIETAAAELATDTDVDPDITCDLTQSVTEVHAFTEAQVLEIASDDCGTKFVKQALDALTKFLLPNKCLQHVERCRRCEARSLSM